MKIWDWKKIYLMFRTQKSRKWLWLCLSCLLIGSFFVLSSEVKEAAAGQTELIRQIDNEISSRLIDFRNPKLNGMAVDVTALGSGTVLSIFVAIGSFFLLCFRKFLPAIQLIVSGIGAGVLTSSLKSYFVLSRPPIDQRLVEVQGYSYPSGHSLSSAAVYFTIAILLTEILRKRSHQFFAVGIFLVFIGCIGLTRLYLGVHYFSDVTAGIALGISWASLLIAGASHFSARTN